MPAADNFANTPSGWVTGVGVPVAIVLAAAFGWLIKRILQKLDEQTAAMAEQSRALAVVVTQVAPMQTDISELKTARQNLQEQTAVLKSRVDQHEAWAQTEHERVLRQLRPA